MDTLDGLGANAIRLFIILIAGLMILGELGPRHRARRRRPRRRGDRRGLRHPEHRPRLLHGALILVENQFSKGDVISIAGVSGTVEDFSLRRTTLRDLDGVVHTVPNGEIKVASNRPASGPGSTWTSRVAYGTDIEKATRVVNDVGEAIAADPEWRRRVMEAPHVERIEALGEYGITLKILGLGPRHRAVGRGWRAAASGCSRRSRRTASRSRGRSASSSRATRAGPVRTGWPGRPGADPGRPVGRD